MSMRNAPPDLTVERGPGAAPGDDSARPSVPQGTAEGRRARLLDLLPHHGWLLFTFIAACALQYPALYMGGPSTLEENLRLWMHMDEGTALYDSYRVAMGEVMYRDFFEFQGPVFYYFFAALFSITGPSVLAARIVFILIVGTSAMLLAVLVSRLVERIAGVAVALIHASVLVPYWACAYPHWLAEAFALAGLVLLTSAGDRAGRRVAAGVCLALSALTIQSLGLPILVAAIGAISLPGIGARHWRRALTVPAQVLLGASAVVVLGVLYFGAHGALGDMYYAMFQWPFESYVLGQQDVKHYGDYAEHGIRTHAHLAEPWRTLATFVILFTKQLPRLSVVAFGLATLWAVFKSWKRQEDYGFALIAGSALAASLPLLLVITRADMTHVAFVGSFGLLAIASVFALVSRWRWGRWAATFVLSAVAIAAVLNYGGKVARTERDARSWGEYLATQLPTQWLLANTAPSDTLLDTSHWGALRYMYLRRSAVSYTFVPYMEGYFTDAQWAKLARDIEDRRPKVIHIDPWRWGKILDKRPQIRALYEEKPRHLVSPGQTLLVLRE